MWSLLCPREEEAIRALTDIAVCYLDKPVGASGGYKNQKIADYFLPAGAVWNYLPMHPCSAKRARGRKGGVDRRRVLCATPTTRVTDSFLLIGPCLGTKAWLFSVGAFWLTCCGRKEHVKSHCKGRGGLLLRSILLFLKKDGPISFH